MMFVSNRVSDIPPITAMANGRWVCEPIRVDRAAGSRPKIAVKRGHREGPGPPLDPAHDGVMDRRSLEREVD